MSIDNGMQRWARIFESDTINTLKEEGLQQHRFYDKRDLSRLGISRRLLLRLDVQTIRPNLYYGAHLMEALERYRPPVKAAKTLKGKTDAKRKTKGEAGNHRINPADLL